MTTLWKNAELLILIKIWKNIFNLYYYIIFNCSSCSSINFWKYDLLTFFLLLFSFSSWLTVVASRTRWPATHRWSTPPTASGPSAPLCGEPAPAPPRGAAAWLGVGPWARHLASEWEGSRGGIGLASRRLKEPCLWVNRCSPCLSLIHIWRCRRAI